MLTDPERLPAALVTGDDGEPLTITVPCADVDIHAQIWRVDVGRVPLLLLDTELPRTTARRAGSPRASTTATPRPAWRSTRCSASAASRALEARRRRPGRRAPQRGPRGVRVRWRGVRRTSAARAETIFTTHTPGAGRQRHLPAPTRCCSTLGRFAEPATSRTIIRTRPHPPRRRARAVRRDPVRAAHERRAPTASAPATARSRATCGATSSVPITHVTNGVHVPSLGRRADAQAARRAPRRRLGRARGRPRDLDAASTTRPTRRCGRCATSSARGSSTGCASARRSTGSRAATRATSPRPPRRAFDPNVLTLGFARRVATYKRLNLLFRDPERAIALLTGDRPGAAADLRQGAPEGRRGQAARAGAVRAQGPPRRRRARRLPRGLRPRHRRAARARLRRVGQRPASAARGLRHLRA